MEKRNANSSEQEGDERPLPPIKYSAVFTSKMYLERVTNTGLVVHQHYRDGGALVLVIRFPCLSRG